MATNVLIGGLNPANNPSTLISTDLIPVQRDGLTVSTFLPPNFVNLANFDAKGDGVTDDTDAIADAIATGLPIQVNAGIFITRTQTITQDTLFFGTSKFSAIFKLKNSTNDNMFSIFSDSNLSLYNIKLEGNYNNNSGTSNGIVCSIGSLNIENCFITNFKQNCIVTGNLEYPPSGINTYAHDIYIQNNIITQPTSGVGDCLRMFKIQRGSISGNQCNGGLSQIRSSYYCSQVIFDRNICNGSFGDVGVTASLSTDIVVSNNICTNQFSHGIEIDGVIRGTITGNVGSNNGNVGLSGGEYGPPNSSYDGYLDGVLISYPTQVGNLDCVFSNNTFCNNGKVGVNLAGIGRSIFTNNIMDNNNTTNDPDNAFGLFISGGSLNIDDVYVANNKFINQGYQTGNISQNNVQFMTVLGNNDFGSGQITNFGTIGIQNLINPDPYLLNTANINNTAGSLVADNTSITGYARQIVDSSGSGDVVLEYQINNVSAFSEKLLIINFRNANTMSTINVYINLYTNTSFQFTVFDNTFSGLNNSVQNITLRLASSLSSYNYDNIRIGFGSSVALTGAINIQQISLYSNYPI